MHKVQEKRFAGTHLIIGFPGVGKTTLLLRLLGWDSNNNKFIGTKRTLILSYATDDMGIQAIPEVDPRYLGYLKDEPGMYRLNTEVLEFREILKCIKKHFKNGFVVLDDCTDEIGYNPNTDIKNAIRGVRHPANDLFFLHQHMNDVSPFVYKLAWYVSIFRQADVEFSSTLKNKISRYNEMVNAFNWVQNKLTPIRDFAFVVTNPLDSRFNEPFIKVSNTKK